MEHCYYCNSEGLEPSCPKCGRSLIIGAKNSSVEITDKLLDKMFIPQFYMRNLWDYDILRNNFIEYVDMSDFDTYCSQLNKCYNIFRDGGIPSMSALITSPTGFSKTTFAYSCLIQAVKHGYKCVPLIDTSQLKRLLVTASEKPTRFFYHDGFEISSYLSADILFCSVTKGPEYEWAYETIVQILDIRSRLDKPTIIISDFNARYLCSQDKLNMLSRIINFRGTTNPYKYPGLISFEPIGGIK